MSTRLQNFLSTTKFGKTWIADEAKVIFQIDVYYLLLHIVNHLFSFFSQTADWLGHEIFQEVLNHLNSLTGSSRTTMSAQDILRLSTANLKTLIQSATKRCRDALYTCGVFYFHTASMVFDHNDPVLSKIFQRYHFSRHIGKDQKRKVAKLLLYIIYIFALTLVLILQTSELLVLLLRLTILLRIRNLLRAML